MEERENQNRLPESTAALTVEAVKAANKYGPVVSYDLNYRPSLSKTIGGLAKAQEVNREIAKYVDVMIGNEEDFTASLGFEVEGVDHNISAIELDAFKAMIETAVKTFQGGYIRETSIDGILMDLHSAFCAFWVSECQEIRTKSTIPAASLKGSRCSPRF